ncbi:cobaltochelatase subunit CobN [Methylohalomonas lacus]|uniref:cobaltochelatase subunit CobN n=1 Tax=Methylohalomonas lacus TaxID=398773 RepID=UPI003898E5A9
MIAGFLLFAQNLAAASLFGVVSERSASLLAAGAGRFLDQYPDHELVLRNTRQVAAMSDAELRERLATADSVLLVGVFGDQAVRLEKLLASMDRPPARLLAFNGERRLTRLSRLQGEAIMADLNEAGMDALHDKAEPGQPVAEHLRQQQERFPPLAGWLEARAYWQGRGSDNAAGLLAWLLQPFAGDLSVPEPELAEAVRYYHDGKVSPTPPEAVFAAGQPVVAVLDHDTGDVAGQNALMQGLCAQLRQRDLGCLGVIARWGAASAEALETLPERLGQGRLAAVVSLQDFVIGGSEARGRGDAALEALDVPVIKGLRLTDRDAETWRLSDDGLPVDSVHYRLAMPELQGIGQAQVLAVQQPAQTQQATGLRYASMTTLPAELRSISERVANWQTLRHKANQDKRIGIVYYNHPPGRHNIGADNLDVPESLLTILRDLKAAGYDTGELPDNAESLLEMLQTRGVNLPENREALAEMAAATPRLPLERYRRWFESLPAQVQGEVNHGPLGYLHDSLRQALENARPERGRELLERMHADLKHMLAGVDHPARDRARDLLAQLVDEYRALLAGEHADWAQADRLQAALLDTGIASLDGWGEPPGDIMVHDGEFVLPGLRFGKVFIGPQPPRGWERHEELLHANLSFPPPHQYLAWYHWLRAEFRADALVHLGRHSTYEFLPHKHVGLTQTDYPRIVIGDTPVVYPYIVDGVGEGLQAKRRGLAVIVDHLTPPLSATPLYDDLLQLRQQIESYEAASGDQAEATRSRAFRQILDGVKKLELETAIERELQAEFNDDDITLETVDDEMLVHEVGHYLTEMQEDFMPHGLHVFGRDWDEQARSMMLESMAGDGDIDPDWRAALERSPGDERDFLLAGLAGRYIPPAKGNDPVRTPDVLPTGRNFHGLNGDLLPTSVGYELGRDMAQQARNEQPSGETGQGSEAVILWASDTVRDEGAMVAFGLDMLGVRPSWNGRGIVDGLERLPLNDGRYRRDVVFTTSGLFRDLYGSLLTLVDRAVRVALAGAGQTIRDRQPQLAPALDAALAPVRESVEEDDESLQRNLLAGHWVTAAREAMAAGADADTAGRQAILRVFGDAPGGYGAGINRLVERSASWSERGEIAAAYLRRMGHAYGAEQSGTAAHDQFERALGNVRRTYLGRASNLYGLMDNNDAFDYLGGLSMAVEEISGSVPDNNVINHADPDNPNMRPLDQALQMELQGQFLNPAWIKPLMAQGYAGARTMGSKFLEYLWGWQVTNPDSIQPWMWESVKAVYIDDKHGLELDRFLRQDQQAPVLTNMLAIMLVAIHKDFWPASEQTVAQLSRQLARMIAEHGLPGSGHTRPDHPMLDWVAGQVGPELREAMNEQRRAAADAPAGEQAVVTTTVAELQEAGDNSEAATRESQERNMDRTEQTTANAQANADQQQQREQQQTAQPQPDRDHWPLWALLTVAVILLAGGFLRGRSAGGRHV